MGLLSVSAVRERVMLRPRQEQLLKLRGQSGGMAPPEVWAALKVSKQGADGHAASAAEGGIGEASGHVENRAPRHEMISELGYESYPEQDANICAAVN